MNILFDKFNNIYQKHDTLSNIYTINNSQSIDDIKTILLDFNKNINNIDDCKFKDDIITMNKLIYLQLKINNTIVNFYFLSNDYEHNYYIQLIQITNIMLQLFENNIRELNIYISLDDNKRTLNDKIMTNYNVDIDNLRKLSSGFNVSGLSDNSKNMIILTKKEEICKLL